MRAPESISSSPYVVELDPPPGASIPLRSYITKAQKVLQQFVDVLGRPDMAKPVPEPEPPPPAPVLDGSSGATAAAYAATHDTLQTHSAAWQLAHPEVDSSVRRTRTISGEALKEVKEHIEGLKDALRAGGVLMMVSYPTPAIPAPRLSPSMERPLAMLTYRTMVRVASVVSFAAMAALVSDLKYPEIPDPSPELVPPPTPPKPEKWTEPPKTFEV
ncbi:hypothetical protein OH799_22405 [Nocardia sp. NBC_00881]|uniref:hypothetical protein n=1 Tax=Nocardia sp. NBC_00881 TaxID=2975995 RepID=UPI00386C3467|nr:hypothetical protein OH799_22405 [Nocardia sp. NBC_00881]